MCGLMDGEENKKNYVLFMLAIKYVCAAEECALINVACKIVVKVVKMSMGYYYMFCKMS